MFCPNCGTPTEENQTSCKNCGAVLNAQANPNCFVPMESAAPAAPTCTPGIGLAVASMVLGIVSLVLFCFAFLAIPCAIIGGALGGISLWKAKKAGVKSGMAVAGITCSCISLGILIILLIAVGSLIIAF